MAEKNRYETEKRRMTEKRHEPAEEQIRLFMGEEAWGRLTRLEDMLRERYELVRELRFPFGNEYGWGFRYAHRRSLLLYAFFEEGGFCCTVSINDAGAPKVQAMLDGLRPEIQAIWKNRYACGADGGWLNRVDPLPLKDGAGHGFGGLAALVAVL